MCNIFNIIKQTYTCKPIVHRIKRILWWTLSLILTALVLSNHFALAFFLILLISICYLVMTLLCKKIETICENTIASTCAYVARRTADEIVQKIKEIKTEDNKKTK